MKFIELDLCESTNDEAARYPEKPVVISTKRQTGGRGRQGRAWQEGETTPSADSPVNVFVSMALDDQTLGNAAHAPSWIPLLAGVACIEALQESFIKFGLILECPTKLRLKWPNDIYFDNAKMGGILCESKIRGDKLAVLVIGLGLNLVTAPTLEEIKTASVFENIFPGTLIDTETFRKFFIEKWTHHTMTLLDALAQGQTTTIVAKWKSLARLDLYPEISFFESSNKNQKITVVALDLDESGKLKIKRMRNGREEICLIDQADTL